MPLQTSLPVPPPWLLHMQRYGPPPSYPNLKIPGLNAPIPTVHMLLCPGVEEEYSSLFFHYLSLFVCLSLPLSLSLSLCLPYCPVIPVFSHREPRSDIILAAGASHLWMS